MNRKVLWIVNKYNLKHESEHYFLDFLNDLKKKCCLLGLDLILLRFADGVEQTDFFLRPDISKENVSKELIDRIERRYRFTFRSILYPDLVQLNRSQSNIEMSESSFQYELNEAVAKFVWLENYINDDSFDMIFADQSPEYEMTFAKYIGFNNGIPAYRTMEGAFFGRTLIVKNDVTLNLDLKICSFSVPNDALLDIEFDRISNYAENNAEPYKRTSAHRTSSVAILKAQIRATILKLRKRTYYSNLPKKYLFFSPHLLKESTLHYRATHFSNQTSLIEMIARVLPFNTFLVVREHPHWHERYPVKLVKNWSEIQNVKVISPSESIHEILLKCCGVLTINSTTGLEACAYNKPVITFIPTIYDTLSNVTFVRELHNLTEALTTTTRLAHEEWECYVKEMLNKTFDFSLNSFTFAESNFSHRAEVLSDVINQIVINENS